MAVIGVRDQLATERTHLANERTLLAYLRSSLALCAAGITFLEFFRSSGTLPLGYILLALGTITIAVGSVRFLRARKQDPPSCKGVDLWPPTQPDA